MSFHRNTIWEVRPGHGNTNNGGGFVPCTYVASATISASGAGYSLNDVLTVSTGTALGISATFRVTSVSIAKRVTGVVAIESGGYVVNPTLVNSPTTVSPAGGSGCTLNLTMASSTDYSKQDLYLAGWLLLFGTYSNDLASTDASRVVTSVTGAERFTGSIIGNIINITSGTNATVGRYQITSVQAGVNMTIDRDCAGTGNMSDASGYLGGSVSSLETIYSLIVAGNTIFFQNTGHEDSIAASRMITAGNIGFPVIYEGYNLVRGDLYAESWAGSHNDAGFLDTSGFPVLNTGAYSLTVGTQVIIRCMSILSAFNGASLVTTSSSHLYRVLSTNSFNGAAAIAASLVTRTCAEDCEFRTTGAVSGVAVSGTASAILIDCRITSTANSGFSCNSNFSIINCLFYDIVAGQTAIISSAANMSVMVCGCTFDSCGTCISAPNLAQTNPQYVIRNNMATNCGNLFSNLRTATQDLWVITSTNRSLDNTNNYVGCIGDLGTKDIALDVGTSATEYVDESLNDFRLKRSALATAAGVPSYLDCGWRQRLEGGFLSGRPTGRP